MKEIRTREWKSIINELKEATIYAHAATKEVSIAAAQTINKGAERVYAGACFVADKAEALKS